MPGRESRIDCAFFLGSSVAGTLDEDDRQLVRDVVRAGRVRGMIAGRRRATPGALVSTRPFSNGLDLRARSANYIPTAVLAKRDAIVKIRGVVC